MGALNAATAVAAALWLVAGAGAGRAGTIPCWVDHGAVVAAAAFGDIAGDFIIDLSRPVSALHVTRANLDGIDAQTATGRLDLAGRRLEAVTWPVVDLDPETRAFDTTINGIIGWDVLGRYAVTLDLRGGGCRITLSMPRRRGRGLLLTMVGGAPAVAARIADSTSARSGLFWIDTGRLASRIAGAALSRPMPAGGAPGRLRALSLDGALIEQIPAEPAAGSAAASAIGVGVWQGAWLSIDPAARRLRLRVPARRG
jgi:hypothetical protein